MPFCRVSLSAVKPKGYGYPKEIHTLGDKLRATRMDRRLKQRDVAKLFGVSVETIINWEKNKTKIKEGRHREEVVAFVDYD